MKWVKFKVKTTTEAEDIIISSFYDLGLEGAQIEDKVPLSAWEKEQMFVDILPDGPEDDGIAYLSFFVEKDEDGSLKLNGGTTDIDTILRQLKEELESLRTFLDIGEGSLTVEHVVWMDYGECLEAIRTGSLKNCILEDEFRTLGKYLGIRGL